MLLIEYPTCSTCKKAKAWLDGQTLSYEDRNIKEQNPTEEGAKGMASEKRAAAQAFF